MAEKAVESFWQTIIILTGGWWGSFFIFTLLFFKTTGSIGLGLLVGALIASAIIYSQIQHWVRICASETAMPDEKF